jgi:ATP-dependent Zn protease
MSKNDPQLNAEAGEVADVSVGGPMYAQEAIPDLRTTAIHEAAHAVIGRLLGIPCGVVSIEPEDGESYGSAVIDDPRVSWRRGDGPRRDAANKFATALYAGAEAERVLLGLDPALDGVDQERARACLAELGAVRGAAFVGDEVFDRHEARLRSSASSLVRLHAEKIRAVAAMLLSQRTLASEEVDAIVTQ